jgi:hypothetical protein
MRRPQRHWQPQKHGRPVPCVRERPHRRHSRTMLLSRPQHLQSHPLHPPLFVAPLPPSAAVVVAVAVSVVVLLVASRQRRWQRRMHSSPHCSHHCKRHTTPFATMIPMNCSESFGRMSCSIRKNSGSVSKHAPLANQVASLAVVAGAGCSLNSFCALITLYRSHTAANCGVGLHGCEYSLARAWHVACASSSVLFAHSRCSFSVCLALLASLSVQLHDTDAESLRARNQPAKSTDVVVAHGSAVSKKL